MGRRASRNPASHFLVRGSVDGWFVCMCGCGYVAVCRHCMPGVSRGVDEALCDAEQRRLKVGKYAEDLSGGNA
jgi:hypothetical protein